MNRILAISVITAFAAIMGSSIIAPAIADHGEPIIQLCRIGEIYDPNTISCIPEDSCPNGITRDANYERHCKLDSDINDTSKFVLCHQPYKSNADPVTIEVSWRAVEKHLTHGDTFGACYI